MGDFLQDILDQSVHLQEIHTVFTRNQDDSISRQPPPPPPPPPKKVCLPMENVFVQI